MLICGLKLTHDGGLALVEDGRLRFSVEMEKLDNSRRFQPLDRLERAEDVLAREGVALGDIDRFVVDGWFAPQGQDQRNPLLHVSHQGRPVVLPVAAYQDLPGAEVLARRDFIGLPLGSARHAYSGYHHSTQHLMGSYTTSPFARRGQDALVLVWDGGMTPVLYRVEPQPLRVTRLGELFPLYGSIFADFCAALPPFRGSHQPAAQDPQLMPRNLDVAGKAMAYAALGTDDPGFDTVLTEQLDAMELSFTMGDDLAHALKHGDASPWPDATDADLIATFQGYVGRRLHAALGAAVRGRDLPPRLCLAGGCALNIKWNNLLRSSGLFEEVWVPPFPNDSGAALGAAATEWARTSGRAVLDWSVYQGPRLRPALDDPPGWTSTACDVNGLARELHDTGAPVVVLTGRAELGPRALGHRSIFAPATDAGMKEHLNRIKDREEYRPVAPVCLEHRAPELFAPGTPDPHMLFDHDTRVGWEAKVPAVVHLDGTARLQTVNDRQSPFVHELLTAYEKLSGIPLLCNTSANHKGRGFFPDVASAAAWGRVPAIWSEGRLYRRT
ncbi:carbamoyltransferase N-terminal domain-containing protein [Streptomyces sp. WZ-12]|uniref:carbamoyltransferase N-terminal domain-containing protein n=1 Tax=Streptomyces sp. WZ-12 TaxID=3030210 RepID=UPI002381775A|nr:carbamoyltransferase N-terminal domain-containing protein [Streptomyces sp. WZ-12]